MNKKVAFLLITLVIIIFVCCIVIFQRNKQQAYINSQSEENEEISQNVKDYLQKETDIKIKTLQSLLKDNDITNLDFKVGKCSITDDNLYFVSYLIRQNNNNTSSFISFSFNKETFSLEETNFYYQRTELPSCDEIISLDTLSYITMFLPFSIDTVTFEDISNTELISAYSEMYSNGYVYLSDYKISITSFYNNAWYYSYKKITLP